MIKKIAGIIPARFSSSRFPGKPLVEIAGVSMIQRVYTQASLAGSLDTVVVATDDERIQEHVRGFGGKVVMTSPSHVSGTDRCFEALESLDMKFSHVINIQGDEPFISPNQIDLVANCFTNEDVEIATLVKKVIDEFELKNSHIPKVVLDDLSNAIYFSRQCIPYLQSVHQKNWIHSHDYFRHIGIYGYSVKALSSIVKLPVSKLEKAESLEQLRWLSAGFKIRTAITMEDTCGVDTPEDIEKVIKLFIKK